MSLEFWGSQEVGQLVNLVPSVTSLEGESLHIRTPWALVPRGGKPFQSTQLEARGSYFKPPLGPTFWLDPRGSPQVPPPGNTTLILKNLPKYYDSFQVLDILLQMGFPPHQYSFLHVPLDANQNYAGYAYVNLMSPEILLYLVDLIRDFPLRMEAGSILRAEISPLQGMATLLHVFRRGCGVPPLLFWEGVCVPLKPVEDKPPAGFNNPSNPQWGPPMGHKNESPPQTTVTLQNLPRKFRSRDLVGFLEHLGFSPRTFNLIYAQPDSTGGFVNFGRPEICQAFLEVARNQHTQRGARRGWRANLSHVQGFQSLLAWIPPEAFERPHGPLFFHGGRPGNRAFAHPKFTPKSPPSPMKKKPPVPILCQSGKTTVVLQNLPAGTAMMELVAFFKDGLHVSPQWYDLIWVVPHWPGFSGVCGFINFVNPSHRQTFMRLLKSHTFSFRGRPLVPYKPARPLGAVPWGQPYFV